MRSTHRRCRAGHPFTHSQDFRRSGIWDEHPCRFIRPPFHPHREPLRVRDWQADENGSIQQIRASWRGTAVFNEFADATGRERHRIGGPGFLPMKAPVCAGFLPVMIVSSVLLRQATSIRDGPEQKHDGGEDSHVRFTTGQSPVCQWLRYAEFHRWTGIGRGRNYFQERGPKMTKPTPTRHGTAPWYPRGAATNYWISLIQNKKEEDVEFYRFFEGEIRMADG